MGETHLLVLIHGMWGNAGHLAELDRVVVETIPGPSLHVLRAETNQEDGREPSVTCAVDQLTEELQGHMTGLTGAASIADEIEKLKKEGRTVTRFSITGYSLGGLVARYVIGVLRQRGFFENVAPVNFNTIATPHIGLPRYPSFFSSVTSFLGPKLLSRTGEQFYCADKWSAKGRPLLEVMADPDRIFYQALAAFETIRIYANTLNDVTVPYVTAAIEVEDIFAQQATNGLEVEIDEQYAHLIKSYTLPPVPPPPAPKPTMLSPSWFKQTKPSRPFLPPFLQFRFPMNIVLYAALPFLIPVVISMVLVRLSLATRSSRARIKLLESDASSREKLVYILAQLEHQVEGAVVEFIDDNAGTEPTKDPESARKPRCAPKPPSEQPILTPTQRRIAAALNRLPLKKERAYFPHVRNSHAMIVCRDVKNFELHREGEGILRHWADSFVI
ncbi:putative serine esterase-domain-containing protein [Mycena maculata]|uniref:Serine esterase-domain-containing protein n=1 Tax=Mycena maculata TaxID=230809 RepID=A0AAD7HK51_9AGAR|nr:putative serine esterase-domain-containing protein [Mycena maculata]